MAHAVQGRYPFLDYRVIEFCARLPDRMKLNGLQEKWLLRQVARDLVPEEIWRRRKRPYRAPIRRTFFAPGAGTDYVSDMLAPESISRAGYFSAEAVAGLVRKAREVGERLLREHHQFHHAHRIDHAVLQEGSVVRIRVAVVTEQHIRGEIAPQLLSDVFHGLGPVVRLPRATIGTMRRECCPTAPDPRPHQADRRLPRAGGR